MTNESHQLSIGELDNVSGGDLRSGAEMAMISIQSLVSQRQTALQLVTSMLGALNAGSKDIAGKIGH